MANYELVAGDGGSVLHVTILDSVTQLPINLTGKTVKVRFALNGGTTSEHAMTVLDQAVSPGHATYQFSMADLSAGGTIVGEVRLQAGVNSEQLTTIDTFHIPVKTPLP